MREWHEIEDQPLTDELHAECCAAFDPALALIQAECPRLGPVIDQVMWVVAKDPIEGPLGRASTTGDGEIAIALSSFVRTLSTQSIAYIVAHELAHVWLGHLNDLEEPPETVERMRSRVYESQVNALLAELGIDLPAELSEKITIADGQFCVGFDVAGLNVHELWQLVNGEITWDSARSRAAAREDKKVQPGHLSNVTERANAPAQEFWRSHEYRWLDTWTADHDAMAQQVQQLECSQDTIAP